MPDPISSVSPNAVTACIDDGSESSTACSVPPALPPSASQSLMCVPDDGTCTAPGAVKSLVAQFSPPSISVAAPGSSANGVWYDYSGPTPDGASTRTEVAFVKSPDQTGTALQALDVSAVTGHDHDLQLTALHASLAVSHAGFGLSVSLDGPTARANLGEHNDDGSLGGNIGLSAELVGVEATLSTPVASLTAGASASVGVSGSMGVRDVDHDGKPEFCAKFSIPAYTVGACLEQFW